MSAALKPCFRYFLAFVLLAIAAGLCTPRAAGQQIDPSLYAGMRWRSIGPYRSGNVYAVAGIPGDPTTYYIGLPEGGVWKTTDAGTVWKPIFDQEHVPSIGSVAVAPSDPNIVYVGTGDPTGWSFTPGKGMYKSTDAGKTWTNVGLDNTLYIPALLVDPRNPNLVLAGALGPRGFGSSGVSTARGVYRSTDGGRNWKQVLYVDAHTGVGDMAWDYTDPRVVYAAFSRGGDFGTPAPSAPAGPILYKSTNEGVTWKPLSQQGLPVGLRSATIAVAAGTHGQRVYVLLGGLPGGRARGVYRSDDGGTTWQLATEHIASAGGRIYVDPHTPDIVYLMGTSMYRSLDGGHTFVSYKGAPGGDDDRALWVDPTNPQRMIMGVDQGPTISVDGGKTWTPWFNLPNGQIYHVSTDDQFPYWVYGAQQDSGTVGMRSRGDYGDIRTRDWYPVGGFEAGYIAVDPLDPRWIFTQGWYHVLRRFDRETGQVAVVYTPSPEDRFGGMPPLVYSPQDPHVLYMGAQYVLATSDGGIDWRKISPDLTAARAQAALPANSSVARFRPSAETYESEEEGEEDEDMAGNSPQARFRPSAIETLAPSPVAAGEIWAGTSNGLIQLTRDGGQTWSNVSPPALTERSGVIIIDASHHDAGTAYAAVEDTGNTHPYIYRTTDFGATWQPIVAGLPDDVRVRSVREDPVDPQLLYAATEMGVWVSFDQGDDWQSLQLNLPNTVVSDLDVHGDDLVISTYGRSFWILDDVTPLRQIRQAMAAEDVYFYRPEVAMRVRWSNNHDTPLPPEVPAGQNPPEGAIIDYCLKTAAIGPVTLAIYDASGNLVREYSNTLPPPVTSMPNVPTYWFKLPVVLPTTAGMHRLAWDMRYPTPKALTYSYYGGILDYTEYTLTWHAIIGETPRVQPVGPMAVPGTYTIKLTVDGQTYSRQLTVRNDPRSAVSQSDLEAQLQAEKDVMAGLSQSYDAYYQIEALRKTLAADESKAKDDANLVVAAQALDSKMGALIAGTGDGSFGLANRDLGRRIQDLEFGDLRPTPSDMTAIAASCRQIDAAAAALRQIDQQDIPALNAMLAGAHLGPLPAPTDPPGPACGQ